MEVAESVSSPNSVAFAAATATTRSLNEWVGFERSSLRWTSPRTERRSPSPSVRGRAGSSRGRSSASVGGSGQAGGRRSARGRSARTRCAHESDDARERQLVRVVEPVSSGPKQRAQIPFATAGYSLSQMRQRRTSTGTGVGLLMSSIAGTMVNPMQYGRIHDLPPRLRTTVDQLKRRASARGSRRDRPRLRQPRHPLPADRGREARGGRRQAGEPPLLGKPRAPQSARGRLRAVPREVRRRARPRRPRRLDDRREGGAGPSDVGAARGRRQRGRPEPELPDPSRRAEARRRHRRARAVPGRRPARRDRRGRARRAAGPTSRDRVVPPQPDDGDRDSRVDAAPRRPGARARVRARPRLRLRRHRLRRPRAAVPARSRRRPRLRGGAVQPHQVLLDGGLADGLHASVARTSSPPSRS